MLEKAKGTLLEHHNITVVSWPAEVTSIGEGALKPRSPESPAPNVSPPRLDRSVSRARVVETDEGLGGEPGGRTFSFQLTVESRSNPVAIRGSFTITPIRAVEIPKSK